MVNVGIAFLALAGLFGLAVLLFHEFRFFFIVLVLAAAGLWCIFPLRAAGRWIAGLPWWVWAGAAVVVVVVLAVWDIAKTTLPPEETEGMQEPDY